MNKQLATTLDTTDIPEIDSSIIPRAYLFTNVMTGDVTSSVDPNCKTASAGWKIEPLYTISQPTLPNPTNQQLEMIQQQTTEVLAATRAIKLQCNKLQTYVDYIWKKG